MKFFKSNKDINAVIKSQWGDKLLEIKKDKIYVSTTGFFLNLTLTFKGNDKLKDYEITEVTDYSEKLPLDITHKIGYPNSHSLDELIGKVKDVNILIINGFVSGIGDNLIGLRALEIFHDKYKDKFNSIRYEIYNENWMRVKDTIVRYGLVSNILDFPQPASSLAMYDAMIDLDNVHMWQEFATMPMIDCFLLILGIDPSSVDRKDKKLSIPINKFYLDDLAPVFDGIRFKNNKPLLLFQYESSAKIRGITDKSIVSSIIKKLINSSDFNIVILSDLDISSYKLYKMKPFSKTLDHYFTIIKNVDYVLTTDTSAYHIADAFNKPTVALFTSINPKLRTSYYDYVTPIYLPGTDNNPIFGYFDSNRQEHLDYVNKLWKSIKVDEIIKIFKEFKI